MIYNTPIERVGVPMIKVRFTEEEKAEINEAYNNCKNVKKLKILEVLKLRSKGKRTKEVSEITGYCKEHIVKVVIQYKKEGLESILENKYKGNNRKLTVEEEKELIAPFKERAEKGEMVTVAEMKAAYDEKTGAESSIPTIYLLLHRHNWRKVMPRSKNPKKASEEEIIAYKKNQ